MAIRDSMVSTDTVTDQTTCYQQVTKLSFANNRLCTHLEEQEVALQARDVSGCEYGRKLGDKMKRINDFKKMTLYQVICVFVLIVGGAIAYGKSQANTEHIHEAITVIQTEIKENNTLLLDMREKQIEVRKTLELTPR